MNRYKELIQKAKKYYESGSPKLKDIPSGKKRFDLEWCPGLEEEINLWTYWQGGDRGKDGMSAEILLVGQDFGCCRKNNNTMPFVQELINSSGNTTDRYVEEIRKHNKESYSDLNLLELFATLGNEYRADKANPRLFFTNLCLGYRSVEKISGGNLSAQMLDDCEYLKELIDILRPKVVICLGQATYVSAVRGLLDDQAYKNYQNKIKQVASSFNAAMDSGNNHIQIGVGGYHYEIFAMPHPGYLGTSNRKRYSANKTKLPNGLEIMKEDWKAIKTFLR